MSKRAIIARLLLFCVIFAIELNCRGQNSQPTEYQIKAAFIYNFAKFVDWPTQAFTDATSPMIIGVLGKNNFGQTLEQTVSGKNIRGHPLQFKVFQSVNEATHCQILFISSSEKNHLSKILPALDGASILTVSETDNFMDSGGMINLRIIDQKVRFEINNSAAKSVGLTISSKLLSLAIAVR